MNIHLIIIMLINAAELFVIDTMFCLRQKRRKGFFLRLFCCLAIDFIYIFLLPIEHLNYFFIHLPVIIVAFLYVGFCYEVTVLQAIFIGTVGYSIKHISSLIISILSCLAPEIFNHFETTGKLHVPAYILMIMVDIVSYIVAYYILARKLGRWELQKSATISMTVLGAGVLVMNQFWSLGVFIGTEYLTTTTAMIEYIWNIAFCILALVVQLNLVLISQKDKEIEIVKKLIADKEQQYKISKSNVEQIRKKIHDLKYEIAAINMGIDSEKHAQDAMEMLRSLDCSIRTGSTTLDIIFNEKNYYCQGHDIVFTVMTDGKLINFMEPTDQYVLFGNLIDNAIYSVRQIANHSKRYIYINIFPKNSFALIQLEYPYDEDKGYISGMPKANFKEKIDAGLGMTSIRMIAEKYNGSISTKINNDIFMVNILVPIPEGKTKKKAK